MDYLCNTWDLVLSGLKKRLSEATVQTWFDEVRIRDFSEGCMTLLCENEFKLGTIRMHFTAHIVDVLEELFCKKFRVEITGSAADVSLKDAASSEEHLNFDTFIPAPSNEMAYTLVKRLSETGDVPYNPIFLYGVSGVGKTHLLYACCQEMRKSFKGKRILAVGAEEMTDELIQSIRDGTEAITAFRKKYCTLDALFVDDIQFITGKMQTQEEFFHIFHAITAKGGQIVMASNCPPDADNVLDEHLRSRFACGVFVEIGQPEKPLMKIYVERYIRTAGLDIPQACSDYLACRLVPSIRCADGALHLLKAKYVLTGERITVDLIKKELKYYLRKQEDVDPEEILSAVTKCYNCHRSDLIGKSRASEIVKARLVAIYLLREVLDMDLMSIGKIFERDYTTIFYGLHKLLGLRSMDEDLNREIKGLEENLAY